VRQLAVPAELPQTLAAYRLQQKRWTQGWAQLQRLHLASLLWRYRTGLARKAFLVYVVCISWQWPLWMAWIAVLPFLMAQGWWLGAFGTGPALLAYLAPPLLFALFAGVAATLQTRHGQGSHQGSWLRRCARLGPYLVINTGLVPHHVCAFAEGLFGPLHAEFERTPKTASVTAGEGAAGATGIAPVPTPVAAPAPARATPAAASARLRQRAYQLTEAAFGVAQLGWIGFFASQGMAMGMLGAGWVLACMLMLRCAPLLHARWPGRRRAAAGRPA